MKDEAGLLQAIRQRPSDAVPRLVYADWLEERDDPRACFVRTHLLLRTLPPDHPCRREGEPLLSRLRRGCEPAWLEVIEPEGRRLSGQQGRGWVCDCYGATGNRGAPELHGETQDTEGGAWARLLRLIDEAAADGRAAFRPRDGMTAEEWSQIRTVPASIGALKAVRELHLYGSFLVRLPPEVGDMEALTVFTPYTSYRLHWYPYEITRCPDLQASTVSTRSLYGGGPGREGIAFPRLTSYAPPPGVPYVEPVRECSVCRRAFTDQGRHRVWISLRVATDVLPLLVNACSGSCVGSLPAPAAGYPRRPHRGGPGLPPPREA